MLRDTLNHRRVVRGIRRKPSRSELGMTLLELIIACAILMVLSSAALPIAKYTMIRQKEAELRRDLRENERCHRPLQRCSRPEPDSRGNRERRLSTGFGNAGEACAARRWQR